MRYTKVALSIEQALELLDQRGLVFLDKTIARKYFEHIGYFRLTGYLKYYQDTDTDLFYDGITFDQVLDLYIFDRKLRLHTLDAIEKIEVSFKSTISNYMSQKYGVFRYADTSLFVLKTEKAKKIYDRVANNIQMIVKRSSVPFVKEYYRKYDEANLPSRMLMEELTLGDVGNLYNLLQDTDAKNIAKSYGTYFGDLRRRIHLCTTLRNISAHHGRLRNRKYVTRLRKNDVIFKHIYQTYISNNSAKEVIPNYFNSSLVLAYMLKNISPSTRRLARLEALFAYHTSVVIASMGFEDNRKSSFT